MATQYTIRINLGGNLVQQLTAAERILTRINGKVITMKGAGAGIGAGSGIVGGARSGMGTYRNIPASAMARMDGMYMMSRRLGNNMSQDAFYKRFNNAFAGIHRFRSDFIKNSFSVSGWGRNLNNLTSAVGGLGKAAAAAAPMIAGMTSAAIGLFVATKALPTAIGGIAFKIANKMLFSEEMTQAIGNRAQFNLAKNGLKDEYSQAYSNASGISMAYGYNRSQVLGTINSLSGLDGVDIPMATNLARIAGKISTFGSRPYDMVALNLQQILASGGKPNSRDIRELLHAAPILTRFAQEDMREKKITGMDAREYLASSPQALMGSLQRFDKEYQPSNVAGLRGLVELEKTDRWMMIEEKFDKFFELTANTALRIEKSKTRFATSFDANVNLDNFETITNMWSSFMDGLMGFAAKASAKVIDFGAWLARAGHTLHGGALQTRDMLADPVGFAKGLIGGYDNRYQKGVYTGLEKGQLEKNVNTQFLTDMGNSLLSSSKYSHLDEETKSNLLSGFVTKNLVLAETGWEDRRKNNAPGKMALDNRENVLMWSKWSNAKDRSWLPWTMGSQEGTGTRTPQWNANTEQLQSNFRSLADEATGAGWTDIKDSGIGAEDTKEIESLTKDSKSLIINFNAPLVELDNTYNTGADAESIRSLIERDIDTMISRGFQIAMNNTTRMA